MVITIVLTEEEAKKVLGALRNESHALYVIQQLIENALRMAVEKEKRKPE